MDVLADAVRLTADRGWALTEGLFDPAACAALIKACPLGRVLEVQETGPVRFRSWTAGAPVAGGPAAALHESLAAAAAEAGLPVPSAFTEGTWSSYPEGAGFISEHRDPVNAGGIVLTLTLQGIAEFRVTDEAGPQVCVPQPGDAVLLRGGGWPSPGLSRLPHAAQPPAAGERMVLTLRANLDGAGAVWRYGD